MKLTYTFESDERELAEVVLNILRQFDYETSRILERNGSHRFKATIYGTTRERNEPRIRNLIEHFGITCNEVKETIE
ncbi:hypothetical protein [Exiguobacterium flavidum]|uniref:hypothetical protein n=1 Tax=Exiguobacterium flavidum TaxID=2184695 RepID=UPI000DF77805|nr:hypothetical protein [Exiguobacterium flavidum]